MKRILVPRLASLMACLMLSAAAPLSSAYAQESMEELKQRMEELEEKNRALEIENAALKQKVHEQAPVAAPSLGEISETDPMYQFLTLGQSKDYLKTERWRIIDQIEQAIPPLYEPVRPFHGYTLPPGVIRAEMTSTIGRNPGDFGRDKLYALFFNDVKVDFQQTEFNLLYGFELGEMHDMMLKLTVPYKFQRHTGSGHPFSIENITMTMEGAGEGLGDVSLTLKKKWLDQGNDPVTFSTMLGAIFPTAEDEEEFNTSQTMFIDGVPSAVSGFIAGNSIVDAFGRNPGDRLFPRSAQPGNGSWGGRVGFGISHQFERSALHGGAIFDILADNDGITPGHELKYGVSYVFPPLPSDRFTVDLSLFGRWKGDEEFPGTITHAQRDPVTGNFIMDGGMMAMFTTPRPKFEHGHELFFSPSLIFIPTPNTRMFVSPLFRVLEPDRGPSPEWMVMGGVTYTFD